MYVYYANCKNDERINNWADMKEGDVERVSQGSDMH